LRRHFREVLVESPALGEFADGPLVVLMNHSSWWDPLLSIVLAERYFTGRSHYGAMDATALSHYAIFRRLGVFGVERGSGAGAARFLRTADVVLSRPGATLWVTPQGRFVDVRQRPVTLMPGVAHVAARLTTGTLLPLALEYTFGEERLPVVLARFGTPLKVAAHAGLTADGWQARLSDALGETQDALARLVIARDREAFEVLVSGRGGIGNWYGWWRDWRQPQPHS
jgi:1-acyl-sn-glycerol-3-phosphate acyltransferase